MNYRIQITVYNTLVAEAILESSEEADRLWQRWTKLRHKKDKPFGGACVCRADMDRLWNVPVGSEVRK